VFRNLVIKDLDYNPNRIREADKQFEIRLRRLIYTLIREQHTPSKSDLTPIGDIIGQTIGVYFAARNGNDAETNRRMEEIDRLSKDPHYKQREQLREALNIVEKIPMDSLMDFYQETKTSRLEYVLPRWRKNIDLPIFYYERKKGKTKS
jgi:hypothetical protein